jgi:N-acetylneuraminic acid mutarotase
MLLAVVSTPTPAETTTESVTIRWSKVGTLPVPVGEASASTDGQYIYVTGGAYSSEVYFARILDSSGALSEWMVTTALPRERWSHQSIIAEGHLFVLGGYYCCWGGTDSVMSAPIQPDGSLGDWSELTPLPNDLYRSAAVMHGEYIYVIGGWRDWPAPGSPESQVYRARINTDGSIGAWTNLTILPQTLHAHAAVASTGHIFVMGGLINLSQGSIQDAVYQASILADGTLGNWSQISTLPQPVHSHAAVFWQNEILVMGGRTNYLGQYVGTTYAAPVAPNGNLGAWSSGLPLPLPIAYHMSTSSDTSAYVIGGYSNGTVLDAVYCGQEEACGPLSTIVSSLVESSGQDIANIASAANDVSTVGDYFLDKLEVDEARFVTDLAFNIWELSGIDWGLLPRGLNHIAAPGYEAALRASWRGWTDGSAAARHWYKPFYDAIHHDPRYVFNATAQAGLRYYAVEAGKAAAKEPIRDWLANTLLPGPGFPIYWEHGLPAIWLGNSYISELEREGVDLVAALPGLALTPTQEAAYREDLLARQAVNRQIVDQLERHRELLWDSYQDALADESQWWNFFGPLLTRLGVIGAMTLAWDGPGFAVASAGTAAAETVYDAVRDVRALAHDEKMVDLSRRYLTGRVPQAYAQIALNTVSAFHLIRSEQAPHVASGLAEIIAMQSIGHYRLWPDLWWAEEESQLDIRVSNLSMYETDIMVSASYAHTSYWAGPEQVLREGSTLLLSPSSKGITTVEFKSEDDGLSPDKGSVIDLLVIGTTDTGLYPVASAEVTWAPNRVERQSGAQARLPAGYERFEGTEPPAHPYPLAAATNNIPGSTNHQLAISIVNPFTMPVHATVTQSVPASITILDGHSGQVSGDAVTWTAVLSPETHLELLVLLAWEGAPGTVIDLPDTLLSFRDPNTGLGDTYVASASGIEAAWPMSALADLPSTIQSGITVLVPVTLTNIANSVAAHGTFSATVSTVDSVVLWSSSTPFNLAAQETQTLTLPITVATAEAYLVVEGELKLDNVRRSEFLAILPSEVGDSRHLFLPLLLRDP